MNAPRKPQRPQKPIDPLLLQRLEELGGRRRGAPLPPPKPGAKPQQQQQQQQRTAAQPTGASADANARLAALAVARGNGKPTANAASKTGRRAKPARNAKLAAFALSAVTTVGLAGVFANQDGGTDSIQLTNGTSANPLVTVAPGATTATTVAATPAATTDATVVAEQATTAATAAPTTVATAAAGVLDGTYVGATDSNRWGNVQVQVVYSGGQISDVQILQYPDGDRKSLRISQIALPTLISESISAQSGDVNTVSGATYTSNSYRASLQSAIDAAKAASGISG